MRNLRFHIIFARPLAHDMRRDGMTKKTYRAIALSGLVTATLSGCAGAVDRFPSLALRDAERATGQFTPPTSNDTAPSYLVSSAKIEDALIAAHASHQRFMAAQPTAASLAIKARGRGIGDDTHSRALIALADLTTLRSETAGALADLDRLEARGATLFAPTDAVESAQTEVEIMIENQNTALDTLVRELER